jgi:hypothetical protein
VSAAAHGRTFTPVLRTFTACAALLGCAPDAARVPGTPDLATRTAPETTHGPHGGEVRADGDVRAEVRALPEGILVWVHTDGARDGSTPGSVHARVTSAGATHEVPLHAAGDHLHAALPLPHGQPAHVRLTLARGERTHVLDYPIAAVGVSGHDHTPLHGGFVAMWGETHVEWAPRATEQRFFVSDGRRETVTAAVSGILEEEGRTVTLAFDPTSGALEARSPGAGTRPVTLRARVGGESFEMRFTPAMLGEPWDPVPSEPAEPLRR